MFKHVLGVYSSSQKIKLLDFWRSGCQVQMPQPRPDPSPTQLEINRPRPDPSMNHALIYWAEPDPIIGSSLGFCVCLSLRRSLPLSVALLFEWPHIYAQNCKLPMRCTIVVKANQSVKCKYKNTADTTIHSKLWFQCVNPVIGSDRNFENALIHWEAETHLGQ